METPKQAACPFCDHQPLILIDVLSTAAVKRYTDTPYSSMASGFRLEPKANTKPSTSAAERPATVYPSDSEKWATTKPLACTATNFAQLPPVILGRHCLFSGEKRLAAHGNTPPDLPGEERAVATEPAESGVVRPRGIPSRFNVTGAGSVDDLVEESAERQEQFRERSAWAEYAQL